MNTTIAKLSTKNLLHNLNLFKSKAPQSQIIAMIKANAYGHGLRSVALRLEHYVASLGVARIEEALALRKAGLKIPILLMEGVFSKSELLESKKQNFQVVIHNHEQIAWLKEIGLILDFWLKINTGMGRLGFNTEEAESIYQTFKPFGIMSHLACADEIDHPLNQQQYNNFINFIKDKKVYKSINNSAGILNFPKYNFDFVRPGLGLYGASPINDKDLDLKPVMTLKAQIISIKKLPQGHSLGYGSRFICPKDMLIGVVAIGYGDGYPITAKDGTPILVNNTICPLVGRVSMDMITIDLSNIPNAQVGDYATLWGEGLLVNEVTLHTQNLPYDLLCAVQNRVIFHWD